MKRLIRPLVGALLVAFTALPAPAAEAASHTEIATGATQFVPAYAQVPADAGVHWVNKELANYPVLIGNHNIVPDLVVGALPGNKPFPTSSPLIAPGGKWECEAASGGPICTDLNGNQTQLKAGRYAYMCGLHPNHMHGILEVS